MNKNVKQVVLLGGGVNLLADTEIIAGKIALELPKEQCEISINYRGQGNRVSIRVDPKRNLIDCAEIRSGYPHTLFRRRLERPLCGEMKLLFSSDWIEVQVGDHYLGSSFFGSTGEWASAI